MIVLITVCSVSCTVHLKLFTNIDIGIFIHENLTFDYHVKSTLNKISKSLSTLNKVKNSLSSTALKSLYYALIHPYFLYCLPVIRCSNQKNINMLALKQKRCIRIICKASYNAHTEPTKPSTITPSIPYL